MSGTGRTREDSGGPGGFQPRGAVQAPAAHIRPRASCSVSGALGRPADCSLLRAKECMESSFLTAAHRRGTSPPHPGPGLAAERARRPPTTAWPLGGARRLGGAGREAGRRPRALTCLGRRARAQRRRRGGGSRGAGEEPAPGGGVGAK